MYERLVYHAVSAAFSPSQALIEAILKVDLYGTVVLLEKIEQLACPSTEELLNLDVLLPENIKDTLHAYQRAKRCNEKRVMAESVKWGEKGLSAAFAVPDFKYNCTSSHKDKHNCQKNRKDLSAHNIRYKTKEHRCKHDTQV